MGVLAFVPERHYRGTDNAGNTAECRARVTVPHDNGR
jgi:hypothetical protein